MTLWVARCIAFSRYLLALTLLLSARPAHAWEDSFSEGRKLGGKSTAVVRKWMTKDGKLTPTGAAGLLALNPHHEIERLGTIFGPGKLSEEQAIVVSLADINRGLGKGPFKNSRFIDELKPEEVLREAIVNSGAHVIRGLGDLMPVNTVHEAVTLAMIISDLQQEAFEKNGFRPVFVMVPGNHEEHDPGMGTKETLAHLDERHAADPNAVAGERLWPKIQDRTMRGSRPAVERLVNWVSATAARHEGASLFQSIWSPQSPFATPSARVQHNAEGDFMFTLGKTLFVQLNTAEAGTDAGHFKDAQANWLRSRLETTLRGQARIEHVEYGMHHAVYSHGTVDENGEEVVPASGKPRTNGAPRKSSQILHGDKLLVQAMADAYDTLPGELVPSSQLQAGHTHGLAYLELSIESGRGRKYTVPSVVAAAGSGTYRTNPRRVIPGHWFVRSEGTGKGRRQELVELTRQSSIDGKALLKPWKRGGGLRPWQGGVLRPNLRVESSDFSQEIARLFVGPRAGVAAPVGDGTGPHTAAIKVHAPSEPVHAGDYVNPDMRQLPAIKRGVTAGAFGALAVAAWRGSEKAPPGEKFVRRATAVVLGAMAVKEGYGAVQNRYVPRETRRNRRTP